MPLKALGVLRVTAVNILSLTPRDFSGTPTPLFPVRPLTVGRVAPNLSIHAFAERTLLPSTTATFRMSDS